MAPSVLGDGGGGGGDDDNDGDGDGGDDQFHLSCLPPRSLTPFPKCS